MNVTETLGERITTLRSQHKLKQNEFGKLFGVKYQIVSAWENDKRKPSLEVLEEMHRYFNCSLYWLITGNEDANHIVCEELGLSNDTVNRLKKKIHLAHAPYMQKAIDYLVSFPPVLMDIYLYLTNDYHPINSDERTLFPEDIERIDRLAILDDLMQLRGIIKGGTIDETGKR